MVVVSLSCAVSTGSSEADISLATSGWRRSERGSWSASFGFISSTALPSCADRSPNGPLYETLSRRSDREPIKPRRDSRYPKRSKISSSGQAIAAIKPAISNETSILLFPLPLPASLCHALLCSRPFALASSMTSSNQTVNGPNHFLIWPESLPESPPPGELLPPKH